MSILSSNVVQIISDQLAALAEKRAELDREIQVIDGKIAAIAEQLGLQLPSPSSLPRLPREAGHHKFVGSLPETMMETLFNADRGYTRADLKRVLREGIHSDTLKKNENTFYNAVKRYLDKGKIVDVDGLLYHPDRAPLPEGEEDPTGQHLANVTSLFGPHKGGAGA